MKGKKEIRAMVAIPVPESCHDCRLVFIHQPDEDEKFGCGYQGIDVTDYGNQRHPNCPLKIVKDGFR